MQGQVWLLHNIVSIDVFTQKYQKYFICFRYNLENIQNQNVGIYEYMYVGGRFKEG